MVAVLSTVLELLPYVRDVWRRFVERGLEITIEPRSPYHLMSLATAGDLGAPWWLRGTMLMSAVNHRSDRLERVIGAHVDWRARRLKLWRRTIARVRVYIDQAPGREEVADIELPPMSKRHEVKLIFDDNVNLAEHGLPAWSELVLALDLVGPIRKVERSLTGVSHDARAWRDREQELDHRVAMEAGRVFRDFPLAKGDMESLKSASIAARRDRAYVFDYPIEDGALSLAPLRAYAVQADGRKETLERIAEAHRALLKEIRTWA